MVVEIADWQISHLTPVRLSADPTPPVPDYLLQDLGRVGLCGSAGREWGVLRDDQHDRDPEPDPGGVSGGRQPGEGGAVPSQQQHLRQGGVPAQVTRAAHG